MTSLSAGQVTEIVSPSGITYSIAASLTFIERANAQADLVALARSHPLSPSEVVEARRAALTRLAPPDLADLLATLDEFDGLPMGEPVPDSLSRAVRRAETVAMADAVYAEMQARNHRHAQLTPYVAARWGLRGYTAPQGANIPPFRRGAQGVPDDILQALPPDDISLIGWPIWSGSHVDRGAEKNSEAPSPSPESL